MSKEVDALVIIGHGHMIAQEAPHYNHEDIGQGLWYVRTGKSKWYDGSPITEEDKYNLYAGEVFLELGQLAFNRYAQTLPKQPQHPNPIREVALSVIDEITPFEVDEVLPSGFAIAWPDMRTGTYNIPAMFDKALAAEPSMEDELVEKWAKAQAVHARRGGVAIMAYNASELFDGLSKLSLDEIAPDVVVFDDEANVVSESHNLGELTNLTEAQACLTEVPYYQTFSDTQKNEAIMLDSALADLKLVSQAITA